MNLLKVGEVARQTGLTVRALHHYEEIGLLKPSGRSDAGFRLYNLDDLMQLQKIKSLQQLGFSLKEIIHMMQVGTDSLSDIIHQHLENLTLQMEKQQALIKRLRELANMLQHKTPPSVGLLLDTLRMTVMYEKYYTPKQLEELAERKKELGDDAISNAQEEWQKIFEQFRELQQKNEPASGEAAQKLASRSHALVEMFTGGDPAIEQSLQNMVHKEGSEKLFQIDDVVFAYMSKAMALAKK